MERERHDITQTVGVMCDNCKQTVTLRRRESGELSVSCGCDSERSIRVATVLPEGWQQ